MKKILLLLPCLFILFINTNCFAQYPGMGAVYRQMNNQFMNQQMNMQQQMSMNMLFRNMGTASISYPFAVTLKNDSVLSLKSKIYTDTVAKKAYVILEDKSFKKNDARRKTKIYVTDTKAITRVDEYISGEGYKIDGIVTDSCWMFKSVAGAINVYCYLPENESEFYGSSTIALQSGDGNIVSFTKKNLKTMLTSDADAIKLFDKNKYLDAIKKFNKNAAKAAKNSKG